MTSIGTGLTRTALSEAAAPLAIPSEMRRATAMMVDVVGSTTIAEKLGPEDSHSLLEGVLQILRGVVARHGGTAMNEMGDGLFALFGAPLSVDRASLAACHASLDIIAEVGSAAEEFNARFGLAPEIRIGLAAGEVLITSLNQNKGPNATGNAVNLAARLQALARPGGVVCAESIVAETRGWARFQPLGMRAVHGFAAPIAIVELVECVRGPGASMSGAARFTGDFVGRSEELDQLHRWIGQQDRIHPVCLILGEAGIGKSRLMNEFARRLADRRLVIGACEPSGTARPLGLAIDILREFAGYRAGMSLVQLSDALGAQLALGADARAMLAELLVGQARPEGEENPTRAAALRQVLADALLALGRCPELLVVAEDLHWIDQLSADVFLCVIRDAPADFRMLGTSRPSDRVAHLPQDRFEVLQTRPLRAADIARIAEDMTGRAVDAAFASQVARQSEGNPFFAIEILHSTAEASTSDPGRIGAIQNVALARFDRLESAVKALLREASALGRRFRLDVLQTATGARESDMVAMMAVAEGIIEPDPADPEHSAWFCHILFRDAIYATMPRAARKLAHAAAGRALQTRLSDQIADYSEVLADHFEAAEDAPNAVRFLTEAARRAFALYAIESCLALSSRAMALIEADPDLFSPEVIEAAASVHIRCLDVMGLHFNVGTVFDAWSARMLTPEGSPELVLLMALVSKSFCHLQQFPEALELATKVLAMAERLGDERGIAYAKVAMTRVLGDSVPGSLQEIERLFAETRAFTEAQGDGTLYSHRMFQMISAYRSKGMMGKAIELNRTFLAFGEERNLPHVTAVANWSFSFLSLLTNDFESGRAYAEVSSRFALGSRVNTYVAQLLQIANRQGMGEVVPVDLITPILELTEKGGDFVSRNAAIHQSASSMLLSGQIAKGWPLMQHCLQLYRNSGDIGAMQFMPVMEAELLIALGGLIKFDRPRPKLGILDLVTLIRLRFTAVRRAKALLLGHLATIPTQSGHVVARAHLGLGLIAAKECRAEEARARFVTAERLFEAEGLAAELARLKSLRAAARV